ncbi:hypothetical protein ABW19_dt0205489 [Dactylella cylindrospora]|nr:hypothetical protein ABW19_dt0205489 [Dactylella cylindrospora]
MPRKRKAIPPSPEAENEHSSQNTQKITRKASSGGITKPVAKDLYADALVQKTLGFKDIFGLGSGGRKVAKLKPKELVTKRTRKDASAVVPTPTGHEHGDRGKGGWDKDMDYSIYARPPVPNYTDRPDPKTIEKDMAIINQMRKSKNADDRRLAERRLRHLQRDYPSINVETYNSKSVKIYPLQERLEALGLMLADPMVHPEDKKNIRAVMDDYIYKNITWTEGKQVLYFNGTRRSQFMTSKQHLKWLYDNNTQKTITSWGNGRLWWEICSNDTPSLQYAGTISGMAGFRTNYYLCFRPLRDDTTQAEYIKRNIPIDRHIELWMADDTGATHISLHPRDIDDMFIPKDYKGWSHDVCVGIADGTSRVLRSLWLEHSITIDPSIGGGPVMQPWKPCLCLIKLNNDGERLASCGIRSFLKTGTDENYPFVIRTGDHRSEVWNALNDNMLTSMPP